MLGWILYRSAEEALGPEAYGVRRLLEVAPRHGIKLQVLTPEQIDIIVTREDRKSVLVNDVPTTLPDFILPRLGANTRYFALAVIRHLERLGVYSVNSSQSIDTVKDKLYTHQILAQSNLPIPKTILLKLPVETNVVEKHLKFPVIVKTLSGSKGSGVFLSTDRNSFDDLMHLIYATNKNANIILQEFIAESRGKDLRVLVVGKRVVAAMQRTAVNDNFKANYSIGGQVNSVAFTPEIEELALQIVDILNLDIAGIDLLFGRDGFKICEVNSSPGFKGLEQCCPVDVPDEIFNYLKRTLIPTG